MAVLSNGLFWLHLLALPSEMSPLFYIILLDFKINFIIQNPYNFMKKRSSNIFVLTFSMYLCIFFKKSLTRCWNIRLSKKQHLHFDNLHYSLELIGTSLMNWPPIQLEGGSSKSASKIIEKITLIRAVIFVINCKEILRFFRFFI